MLNFESELFAEYTLLVKLKRDLLADPRFQDRFDVSVDLFDDGLRSPPGHHYIGFNVIICEIFSPNRKMGIFDTKHRYIVYAKK
jgi:hypothetical protein